MGGGSNVVVVPSVQELAKETMSHVPSRYIRTDIEDPPCKVTDSPLPEFPVIDMEKLSSASMNDSELERLNQVCHEWGFFQLINHGVPYELMETVQKELQDFFNLPMEKKDKYRQPPGEIEGYGQLFIKSEEQKLDWGDMLYMATLPAHLRKPYLIPKFPPAFREALDDYTVKLRGLALRLLECMAKALRIDYNDMRVLFEEGKQEMRMSYYPPCPQPDQVMGLTAHSDAVGITILYQTNEVAGLQVKKDGRWVLVEPLPKAFIVNIGDILEIVTNGRYRSIEHRVIVNSEKERLSLATFYSPNSDGEMGPAPSLISPQNPALFKTVAVNEYYKDYFSRELDGKSHLDHMRIQADETQVA
ncbi:hypothetical protein Nepgr_021261 [Nepenthes gracilis]|uniref:Fe2OG dioxygenase domain-containing protein n=1 Tax=Nepenthes gracilis TaxID=150966 RepID=A0AAD3SYB7_NEPGR|nr:hypothetical protein Nepgr_021261 [Nepenthes gracilis]